MGRGDRKAALRRCLGICEDYNAAHRFQGWTRIEYVSREMIEKLCGTGLQPVQDGAGSPSACTGWKPVLPEFDVRPMSGDYVYATARMIDLAGGDLASKRQARNRFARRYAARTEPYGPQHLAECTRLLLLWNAQVEASAGQAGSSASVKRNKDVIAAREALVHCEELGLRGLVLFAGDQMVGFTLGEMLDETTCSIIIEKTDRQFTGSAQYIFSEFCRQAWAHTQWCNVGDDWDVPSLAWTKESYRPAMRLEKFILRPAACRDQGRTVPQAATGQPASADRDAAPAPAQTEAAGVHAAV
jgi:hypothetical protein